MIERLVSCDIKFISYSFVPKKRKPEMYGISMLSTRLLFLWFYDSKLIFDEGIIRASFGNKVDRKNVYAACT